MRRKYKSNFLTKVIAKIDFLSPINALKEELPLIITDSSKNYFPIPEPKKVKKHEVKIRLDPDQSTLGEIQEEFTVWNFFGKEREKRLQLTPSSMLVEFNKYDSFENFSQHIMTITDTLFSAFDQLQIKRFGLRYINNIIVIGKNKFSWNAYLNKNLLSIFKIPNDTNKIARAFHNLELNFGDYILRFQYGMHNPDYPAPIRKKTFILDYDTYTTGVISNEEIRNLLHTFHDEIENMFENSITEKLRSIMDG